MSDSIHAAIDELESAVEPFAWVAAAMPCVGDRVHARGLIRWVDLKLQVKPPQIEGGRDADYRRGLYIGAEEAIAAVERRGWSHLSVPRIEFIGTLDQVDALPAPPRIIHECQVRLDVYLP